MSFQNLYKLAVAQAAEDRQGKPAVDVELFRAEIIRTGHAATITIDAVDLELVVSPGHIRMEDHREGRHEDAEIHAHIRYHRKLNRCWARFVSLKEMMHIFDSADELVPDRASFYNLLDEIETPPVHFSPMLTSEYRAEWMALLLLCPKPQRDQYKEMIEKNEISRYDLAWKFAIPQAVVSSLLGAGYDKAFNDLVAAATANDDAADPNEPLRVAAKISR